MKLGLVVSRRHRRGGDGALARWAAISDAGIRQLDLGLVAVGGTHDALIRQRLLVGHLPLVRLPYGSEGAVMRLASRVAGGLSEADALDGVIYLMDPVDPSSLYPEAQALKRQCVIHGKVYIATEAGAAEWISVELALAGRFRHTTLPDVTPQTVALIAHDAHKARMIEFAATHFDLLSRFQARVGTGTTGGLLNEMAWSRGWPKESEWVTRFRSGPLGGDAQIAELVLDGRCQKVIFFEDPHVARQHEADIQLLERAVCTSATATTCFSSPAMAERWAKAFSVATAD